MEYIELDVWVESRKLVKNIYDFTKHFPREELYGLTSQMKRSSTSVPANIAEGFGRRTSPDTIQFLHIARGSLYELETQCNLAFDKFLLTKENFDTSLNQIKIYKKLLNGFINYYSDR
ncbi:MAG: four helix bundle protein [Croceivirga sp.]